MENEKEGAQLKKDLQKLIDSARKELGKQRARPDQIMRELYTRVSAKLAQDRTHNISSAFMYLSPYFETEFSNGSGRGLEQKLTKTPNEIFPSDKAAVSELKSALVSTTAGQSRALSELMTGFRKVAYDNKFKTYADFKYDFSNNTKLNGKTRDALIKEAADFLPGSWPSGWNAAISRRQRISGPKLRNLLISRHLRKQGSREPSR
ncbi:MAG: hypothetical protein II922_00950 [Succinimonas sp.]|nr:hypothetical protein [Succinimonas sp.]